MARKSRKKTAQEEIQPTVVVTPPPVEPVQEVDEVTEQRPAQTLKDVIEEVHGQMDQPQPNVPNIGWFKDNFDTKSGAIRYCKDVLHMETKAIARHLGIRYQMVRNVLTNPIKRGANEPLIPKSERSVANPSNIPPKNPS